MQPVLPKKLCHGRLQLADYSLLAVQPGETRMYDTLRRKCYLHQMTGEVIQTVRKGQNCTPFHGAYFKLHRLMKLLPATAPLEQVAMHLLGQLKKRVKEITSVLVIASPFTRMTRRIQLQSTITCTFWAGLLEYWIYNLDASQCVLTDSRKLLVASFFDSVYGIGGFKHCLTTATTPQKPETERLTRGLCGDFDSTGPTTMKNGTGPFCCLHFRTK